MDDDLGEQRPLASPSKIPIPKVRSTSDASATSTAVKPNINRAWVTVLTGPAYLPGTIILADSLRRVESKYPLLVCVTPSVNKTEQNALKAAGCELMVIEPLKPKVKVNIVASRFEDTWTKLAVFGLVLMERLVLLDSDMLVIRNMDELFDMDLPFDFIAANHACVCNYAKDPWADADWNPQNCAYTGLKHPKALTNPREVTPESIRTHHLLNSGLVVFHPSNMLYAAIVEFLFTDPRVPTFGFPDQDLLSVFFKNKFKPIGWQYNALKTMSYEHRDMWSDFEVRNLHFICEKPWKTGRCEGRFKIPHGIWWDSWDRWFHETQIKVPKLAQFLARYVNLPGNPGSSDGSSST
ncbi:uncharacterized protein LAJ45_09534 [Morchella importuna]|uniref:uncharacterized protein n=1 Tax=Morchella importuna TaxID=1174673 RepID=UPI001E8D9467|nr:uncharacterized protein LAJ45_09534 [Morchella importuna]KAH8146341.1 hypothetical protein LAJ45_09534 [Morchella importuna]